MKVTREAKKELNRDLRCAKVYPKATPNGVINQETVGFKLMGEQIVKFAGRLLLAYDRGLREIDITTFRSRIRRSDGTHLIWISNKGRRFGKEQLSR
jgi:hypothetical protein